MEINGLKIEPFANLRGANLAGADLAGPDLAGPGLYRANLARADLRGADLAGADLARANLAGADLYRANLAGADLYRADLARADLARADLHRANLAGANLRGASLSWISHDLTAELLFRAAGDNVELRKIAGLILVSRDWCWDDFIKINDPLAIWALTELSKYVQPDDDAPAVLRRLARKEDNEPQEG